MPGHKLPVCMLLSCETVLHGEKSAMRNKGRRLRHISNKGFGTKSISLDEGAEEGHANALGWTLEQ